MRMFLTTVICLAAGAGMARAQTCSAEVSKTILGNADGNSAEFANQLNPTAAFTLDMLNGAFEPQNASITKWLGHSWNIMAGWNQSRYQSFRLDYPLQGATYRIKVKFWYHSQPQLAFSAHVDGRPVSSFQLNQTTVRQPWVIEFRATSRRTHNVSLSHNYATDNSTPKYAQIDQIEITEQPCLP